MQILRSICKYVNDSVSPFDDLGIRLIELSLEIEDLVRPTYETTSYPGNPSPQLLILRVKNRFLLPLGRSMFQPADEIRPLRRHPN